MKREDISKLFEDATDEQINALLDINSGDIGNAIKKLEGERDNYKGQLKTAQDTLKGFEGVDVKNLQGKIMTLQNDLAAKEKEYQGKLAEMEFNAVLDSAISASGAKSAKALKALLDVDALKVSKNQSDDIKAAIDAVKSENDFLFEASKPGSTFAGMKPGEPGGKPAGSKSLKDMDYEELCAYVEQNPNAVLE